MNKQHAIDKDHALILAYLYDELDSGEREDFEARLQADEQFRLLFEQQTQFDRLMRPGVQPQIDRQRLDGVHWSLQKALRKEVSKRQSFAGALANLWRSQVSFKAQFASMLATFALGVLIAHSDFGQEPSLAAQVNDTQAPLSFIQADDYEITDLQLEQLDPVSGKVKVRYSLASQTQVDGNLANRNIINLLAATMKNDVSDSTRLDLVDVLKNYANTGQVQEALSYSLLNDPNPGVRMAAAESLASLSQNKSVRQVLRNALQNDVNPGVRVEVFQALIQHLDDKATLDFLKQYGANDSNQFIRDRTKMLLNQTNKEIQI